MSSARSPVAPVEDTVIVKSAGLAVPPGKAFAMLTEATHLEAWLCEKAVTGSGVGAPYELFWDTEDPENDSTIGCRITAWEHERLLAFQWRSPRQFKSFANSADPLTHVVVMLCPTQAGTKVSLVHSGWRSTEDWRQAAAWQRTAWDHAFAALARHAATGAA